MFGMDKLEMRMAFDFITAVIEEQGQEYDQHRSNDCAEYSRFHALLQHGPLGPLKSRPRKQSR